jgi:hypothetical protein
MRALSFWLNLLLVIPVVAGIVFALVGFINGNNIAMGVFGVALVVLPVAGAIWLHRIASNQGRQAFESTIRQDFAASRQNWFQASGIALDRQAGRLALGDAAATRIVPLSSVTDVSYVPQRAGATYAGNGFAGIIAAISQLSAAAHNYGQAGLYVSADGRRHRLIGVGTADAAEWQALLDEARRPA